MKIMMLFISGPYLLEIELKEYEVYAMMILQKFAVVSLEDFGL